MAILNATPDSFSDGGRHLDPERAAAAADLFVADGADMLDVGGESTRPGAARVDEAEQIRRVVGVIEAVRAAGVAVPISVDTTRRAVAEAALDAGADAINDVSGGEDDSHRAGGMLALAAERGCGIVLMHRLAPPSEDRFSDRYDAPPEYGDVVGEVAGYLAQRADAAVAAGCDRSAVVLDPGLGFGKTVEQNADLARGTARLCSLGCPILAAASRKSFVGRLSMGPGDTEPAPPEARLGGSVAFSIVQMLGGARLFRVHDVRQQAEALRAAWKLVGTNL